MVIRPCSKHLCGIDFLKKEFKSLTSKNKSDFFKYSDYILFTDYNNNRKT